MSLFSTYAGGTGGIPLGDKLRYGTKTSCASGSETTILTVASGGGMLHHLIIAAPGGETQTLTSLKVTVDGAAERTLTGGIVIVTRLSSVGEYPAIILPLPINFASSLTVKITLTTGGTGSEVIPVYSVN